MSELDQFLEQQSQAGLHQGTGAFAIDFAKAGERRADFALPRPELWVTRLLQGYTRLGVQRVEVKTHRHAIEIRGHLDEPLPAAHGLAELFRLPSSQDPRAPLADAVWGALGRRLKMELTWNEENRLQGHLTIGKDDVQSEQRKAPQGLPPTITCLAASNTRESLLGRMFGWANFSKEVHELTHAGLMTPYPLCLDGRECDFVSGFEKAFFPGQEFRAQRKMMGHGFRLHQAADSQIYLPSLSSEGSPLGDPEQGEYGFVLAIGWSPEPVASTAAWVRDGFLTHHEALFARPSRLRLQLFLSGGGLSTDLTGLALRETEEKRKRLAEARLWALASLQTVPPLPGVLPATEESLKTEIARLFSRAVKESSLSLRDAETFRNEVTRHRRRRAHQKKALVHWKIQQEGARVNRRFSDAESESIDRWGRFLTYTPDRSKGFQSSSSKPPKVEEFFGDVYLHLPRRRPEVQPSHPLKRHSAE